MRKWIKVSKKCVKIVNKMSLMLKLRARSANQLSNYFLSPSSSLCQIILTERLAASPLLPSTLGFIYKKEPYGEIHRVYFILT